MPQYGKQETISVSKLRNGLPSYLDRVKILQIRFWITKNGKLIAELVPTTSRKPADRIVSVSELRDELDAILAEIKFIGKRFCISKNGKRVALLIPLRLRRGQESASAGISI